MCHFDIPRDEHAGYVNNSREKFAFRFDGVIGPDAKQDEVFTRCAERPVLGALDGFNGTVFAYGQTGSGKTFTITGGAERYVDRGIIPRAISRLYSEISKRADARYSVHVSYVEVYNNQAYDLLDPDHETKALEDLPKVTLQEDEEGNVRMVNCSVHRSETEEDALNLLFLGDTNRAITETPMNLASSRSHCIFTMTVERRQNGSDLVRRAKVCLVDLAGSERVAKTGVSGQSLQEAKYINLSLHSLEKVVVALQERAEGGQRSHIPYRDSTMTMMLRDSLGGNCRTVMVATACPEREHLLEGISTCRFAQRIACVANELEVNEELDPNLVIKRLKLENRELRDELRLLRGENDRRGDLTESEIDRLRAEVDAYCRAGGGGGDGDDVGRVDGDDSENDLDLGASMLKIKAAIRIFRDMVRRAWCRERRAISNENANENESDTTTRSRGEGSKRLPGDDADADAILPGAGEDELRAEIARLAETVRKRDVEIKILATTVRGGDGGGDGARRSEAERVGEGTFKPEGRGASSHSHSHSPSSSFFSSSRSGSPTFVGSIPRLPADADVADRAAAYELFRGAYAEMGSIEENKAVLRERYARAKTLGETVNGARANIEAVKRRVERRRVARNMMVGGYRTRADVGDPNADPDAEAEEAEARAAIDAEKRAYRAAFDELRDAKREIDHLQARLERSREKLRVDFERWYAGEARRLRGGGFAGDSATSYASSERSGDGDGDGIGGGGGGGGHLGDVANAKAKAMAKVARATVAYSVSAAYSNGGIAETNATTTGRIATGGTATTASARVPALTGNAQADADIRAFYAAREKLLAARGLSGVA